MSVVLLWQSLNCAILVLVLHFPSACVSSPTIALISQEHSPVLAERADMSDDRSLNAALNEAYFREPPSSGLVKNL